MKSEYDIGGGCGRGRSTPRPDTSISPAASRLRGGGVGLVAVNLTLAVACGSVGVSDGEPSGTDDDGAEVGHDCSEEVIWDGDVHHSSRDDVPVNVTRITGTYFDVPLGTVRKWMPCLERVGAVTIGDEADLELDPPLLVDNWIELESSPGLAARDPRAVRGLRFADAPGVTASIRVLDLAWDAEIEIDFEAPRPLDLSVPMSGERTALLSLGGENWPTEFESLELRSGAQAVLQSPWLAALERVQGSMVISGGSETTELSLPNLRSVGSTLRLSGVGAVALPALTEVEWLELVNLEFPLWEAVQLSPDLEVGTSLVMKHIVRGEFENPISVADGAEVSLIDIESPSLLRVDALGTLSSLTLEANPGLPDLDSVLPASTEVTDFLRIADNPALQPCEVQAFADTFAGPEATVEIPDAIGCMP